MVELHVQGLGWAWVIWAVLIIALPAFCAGYDLGRKHARG